MITWVPLLVDLDLKLEHETRDAQNEGGFAISSFGTYDSLANSVILTLRHFRWSKIGQRERERRGREEENEREILFVSFVVVSSVSTYTFRVTPMHIQLLFSDQKKC